MTTPSTATTASLLPTDIDMFARFRIPLELVSEAGIHRGTDREMRARYHITWEPDRDVTGIAYPYWHPETGYLCTARVRRDHPEIDEDGKQQNKYICPSGNAQHLYFPPGAKKRLNDPITVIVLVESEKAALALTAWAGRTGIKLVALAMGGCWGWISKRAKSWLAPNGEYQKVPGPIDDLKYCNNRTVYRMLDSNSATNPEVRRARTELVVELNKAEHNCRILVCDLPQLERVNGPDDLIANYGDDTMADVFASAYSPAHKSVNRPTSPAADSSAEWPEPEDLGAELPPVPPFDLGLLPASLRPMVEDVAERMQVPIDFPAVASVATLAGICGRRALIQPKEHDHSWIVVPNLWGGVVGHPGMMKTPVIACITKPVHAVEAQWRTEYESELSDANAQRTLTELRNRAWQQQYIAAVKTNKEIPIQPDTSVPEPRRKRLITTDATFEAMQSMMANNPAGIFVIRDELTGLLAGLERTGREQERAFLLECWNGDSPFTVDRIGRGSIHVDHCCVSLFGGIQPARLRAYLADALRDGPTNDGLIQRFQLLVWPDTMKDWRYQDRLPADSAMRAAGQMYMRIAAMEADNPLMVRFSPDAQTLFVAWLTDLEARLRADDVSVFMQAHLAKYRKLMPALALLFALADNAVPVGLDHARQAADCCDYLVCHAHRVYASRISRERLAAISLARRLPKGWKKKEGEFSVRDVYQNDWSGLGTPDEVRAAIHELEEGGWVRAKVSRPNTGRPSEIYAINPKIGGGHADD
jgi:putative DNA primase/helicase